ncbi:MAG TPA: response regulator transcription factor [Anaerolineae bacterium]|nr:response regulator transcription factor [Anaerolineae bacterium]HQI83202.1 response regulator transcription factor [Anaerolineae bacterium]
MLQIDAALFQQKRMTMARTILVVDDKASLRALVKDYLTEQGFRVVTAGDGQQALFVAREEKPDLILLDIMMPKLDGYEFIRIFSKEQDTPIILLTARLDESDKVLGLELGADDYITKPFGMRELLARVRAVLRRAGKMAYAPDILRVADVVLDKDQRTVTVGDKPVKLTPTEFELLAQLMTEPGHVFSRAALLEAVQGIAFEGLERSINVHIRNLRTKIEPDPANPRYIETVFGAGYRFCSERPER